MGEPSGISVDSETMETMEKLAKANGQTPSEFLAAQLKKAARPTTEYRPNIVESLPAKKPRTPQELLEQMMERQNAMMMTRMLMQMNAAGMNAGVGGDNNGGRSLKEDILDAVKKMLDDRISTKKADDEEEPAVFREEMARLRVKAKLKGLKELAGEDEGGGGANRYYDESLKTLKDQLAQLAKDNEALRAEAAKARQEAALAEQKRIADEMMGKINGLQDTISYQQSQIANLQKGGTESDAKGDFLDQLSSMNERLETFKKKIGVTGKAEPDMIDKIDRIAERFTTHFASAGDTAAKLIAAQKGVPPSEYAMEPEAGTASNYELEPPSAPALAPSEVATLRKSVAQMRENGFRCDPADAVTWPDISYSAVKAGKVIQMSRQEWVQEYGHMAAPTLPSAPMRPIQAPPTAPAPVVAPKAPPVDLSRLLGSGTKAPAPVQSPPSEPEVPSPPVEQPTPEPEPPPTATAPVMVNDEGEVVSDPAESPAPD